ncbi:MAG: methylated-DNA--[protein]-cysteine S-methyltransferase [Chloroflexia bacterium]|nr:methylated-DNA--[protein]-cysteine S-methyltransferase [Chloroflexia bacterium]
MGHHDLPNRIVTTNGHLSHPVPDTRLELTMDQFMTTPTPSTALPVQSPIPSNLAAQAADPEVDPCDIAESVMPDLIFGDLNQADEAWVREHTVTCNYCANIMHGLQDVCSALDECAEDVCEAAADRRPSSTMCLGIPEARYGFMESPVGDVLVAASDRGVVEVSYLDHTGPYESLRELEQRGYLVYERQDRVQPVVDQLREYFGHERRTFNLPVDLGGVSDFTRSVLDSTVHIPYGKVQTYGDVASAIGKPKASRAVGNALGRNPVPVIIPCHRVIRSSGAMGWYTGGPDIKRALLGIEGVSYAAREQAAQASLSIER